MQDPILDPSPRPLTGCSQGAELRSLVGEMGCVAEKLNFQAPGGCLGLTDLLYRKCLSLPINSTQSQNWEERNVDEKSEFWITRASLLEEHLLGAYFV